MQGHQTKTKQKLFQYIIKKVYNTIINSGIDPYCERSELLIDAASAKIFPASDSEHRPCRGRVRLAYRDPFGEQ